MYELPVFQKVNGGRSLLTLISLWDYHTGFLLIMKIRKKQPNNIRTIHTIMLVAAFFLSELFRGKHNQAQLRKRLKLKPRQFVELVEQPSKNH